MDKFFVTTIAATRKPQSLVWSAMHQCYSSEPVYGCPITEEQAGQKVVEKLLKGDKGHYGPLEHPQISLSCSYFPHSTVSQLTRHRLATFDVQSFRYTSINPETPIDDVFYFRKPGTYTSREGQFQITGAMHAFALEQAQKAVRNYQSLIEANIPCETARSVLPHDYRQHFIMSVNLRSLIHLLDIRHKPDCQLEIQIWASMVLAQFEQWCPEIAGWYKSTRLNKARLAP